MTRERSGSALREPAADSLPYVWWLCSDGLEVICDRRYRPLLARRPGGPAFKPEREQWYQLASERWLFFSTAPIDGRHFDSTRSNAKLRELARQVLRDFQVGEPVAHRFEWTRARQRATSLQGRR